MTYGFFPVFFAFKDSRVDAWGMDWEQSTTRDYSIFCTDRTEAHLFVTAQCGSLLYKGRRCIYVTFGNSADRVGDQLGKVI